MEIKKASKAQQARDFMEGKTFATIGKAHKAFLETGTSIHYSQFHSAVKQREQVSLKGSSTDVTPSVNQEQGTLTMRTIGGRTIYETR